MKRFKPLILTVFVFILFVNCGDSLKYRLKKRLNNFRNALSDEIRQKFDNKEYDESGQMLDQKMKAVRDYINSFDTEEKQRKYVRGDYAELEEEIKRIGIPGHLLDFNKKFYKVIDFECIPTFTGLQAVDFFKVYFKEKLDSM